PVREAHRGRLEGKSDLLARPDERCGEHALDDGHRRERARAGRAAQEGALLGRSERGRPGPAGGAVRPDAEPRHERPADFRILAAPRSGGVGRADQDRQDRAGQGAAQKGDLLARPVARPARRAGPPGDHQPMIAAVALALALQGGLPDRVAAAPDGEVRLSYATRPGVCGNGRNTISFDCEDGWCGRHRVSVGRYDDDDDAGCPCEPGPARVALQQRGGQVTRLRAYVGGAWRAAGAGVTDLGTVSAAAAARYLLDLAARATGDAGHEAVFPAVLADSVTIWPDLLRLARTASVARETRRSAVF